MKVMQLRYFMEVCRCGDDGVLGFSVDFTAFGYKCNS